MSEAHPILQPVPPFSADTRPTWSAWLLAHWLFGVLLPAGTLVVELLAGWCADALFDPLPTPFHVLMVACVPLANACALLTLHRRALHRLTPALHLNGAALGVAAVYTLLFLPILPIALVALLFGIGALPLAPLFSLLSALLLRRRLLRTGWPTSTAPRWWRGALAAGALFLVAETPTAVANVGLHMAATGAPDSRRQALRLLRALGSEEVLREACYEGPRRHSLSAVLLSHDGPLGLEDARRVYYEVTGQPFNTQPRPEHGLARGWWSDTDVASERVGGRVQGLSLASSAVEGSVDGDAALAYLEWTLELATVAPGQSEARMRVQLPPGAAVSRVTLFIDGEPREAAFASTGEVRAAYEQVVQRRMDPLLVTARPGEQVQVQAFPVEPGKPMKVKLGITAPLQLRDGGRAGALPLPSLVERNFEVPDDFRHVLRLESRRPLTGPTGLQAALRSDGVSEWLVALTDGQLQAPETALHVERTGAPAVAWAEDLQEPRRWAIRQTLTEALAVRPARLLLVVDGSEGMQPALEQLADALAAVPDGVEFALLTAQDGVEERVPMQRVDAHVRAWAAEQLRTLSVAGGQDTHPALARAWTLLAPDAPSLVLWVHGPQPLPPRSGSEASLLALSGPRQVEVVDVQVAAGPNAVLEALPRSVPVRRLPRLGQLGADVTALFTSWGRPQPRLVRERVPRVEPASFPAEAKRTSTHLARLWARDESARLLATGTERGRRAARALAVAHQLVTEVSGAVVLERKEQFDAAGLKPVEAGSVPTVPEPETWLLLLVACALLGAAGLRRRQVA